MDNFMADLLRAENVAKSYGGVAALKGANFALHAGEVRALIGETWQESAR